MFEIRASYRAASRMAPPEAGVADGKAEWLIR